MFKYYNFIVKNDINDNRQEFEEYFEDFEYFCDENIYIDGETNEISFIEKNNSFSYLKRVYMKLHLKILTIIL